MTAGFGGKIQFCEPDWIFFKPIERRFNPIICTQTIDIK
jgi:hypothetical protein